MKIQNHKALVNMLNGNRKFVVNHDRHLVVFDFTKPGKGIISVGNVDVQVTKNATGGCTTAEFIKVAPIIDEIVGLYL